MSIQYNIIQRGEPGVAGGEIKKYYASAGEVDTIGINKLADRIAQLSTVNGADVRAVLYGIIETLPEFLSDGNSVQLGDLGYFRVGISSTGEENEEDVNASSIRRSKILFRPGTRIAEMLNNLSFKKA